MTYISVKEAAKMVNKNERTIRRWIRSGKIEHVLIKGKFHLIENNLRKLSGKEKQRKIIVKKEKNIDGIDSRQTKPNFQTEKFDYKEKTLSEDLDDISYNNVQKRGKDSIETNSSNKKQIPLYQTNGKENNIIRENVEYIFGNEMSENVKNNMSVKKINEEYIGPSISHNDTVEMSENTKNNLSNFNLTGAIERFDDTQDRPMSSFYNRLSTISDIDVDNKIDSSDNIISLNNNKFGHYEKYSGHLDRTIGMSAFAVRLIEEKEKLSIKYREENEWLKNEIIGLRNELSNIREEVVEENKKRANTSDFLIESNKQWQEIVKNNLIHNEKTYDNIKNNSLSKNENYQSSKIKNNYWFGWWIFVFGIIIIIFIAIIESLILSSMIR